MSRLEDQAPPLRACQGCKKPFGNHHCGHNDQNGWWCSPACLFGPKNIPAEFAYWTNENCPCGTCTSSRVGGPL